MKIKVTLTNEEQANAFKVDLKKARHIYTTKGLVFNYIQLDKLNFQLDIKYPMENAVFNWQIMASLKSEFQKVDKNIKVKKI